MDWDVSGGSLIRLEKFHFGFVEGREREIGKERKRYRKRERESFEGLLDNT